MLQSGLSNKNGFDKKLLHAFHQVVGSFLLLELEYQQLTYTRNFAIPSITPTAHCLGHICPCLQS